LPSAFWQGDSVCLKFSACIVNVCASTALTTLWSQMKVRFLRLLFLHCA
jgi:hypothetical protein